VWALTLCNDVGCVRCNNMVTISCNMVLSG
jgi:hypothetical protein